MKRCKFCICLLFIIICICIVFSGCFNDSDDSDIDEEWMSNYNIKSSELYFCAGVDSSKLEEYFFANGDVYEINGEIQYYFIGVNKNYGGKVITNDCVRYYPNSNKIQISSSLQSNSDVYLGTITSDTYASVIEAKIGEPFNKAVIVGGLDHQGTNISGKGGFYTAKLNFSIKYFRSNTELSNIICNSYTSSITYASNYTLAIKFFDPKTTAEQCYPLLQKGINYLDEILKEIDSNYSFASTNV